MQPEFTTLLFELDRDWVTLWLNRPDARNALSSDLTTDLESALDYISETPSIRGVTIRGKGDVFCSGGDLKGFKSHFQSDVSLDDIAVSSGTMGRIFIKMRNLPQVIVMIAHGAALAGGLGLVCAGDIVIATEDVRMGLTETSIGVVPAQIGRYIVERIGEFNARRLMLTGRRFDGLQGVSLGLVDFAVSNVSAAEAQESELRSQVRRCAPLANAATKRLLEQNKVLSASEMVAYAGRVFAESVSGDEGREGVASFLEKRKPRWVESS